ncbi:gamma-aminobutyric acid receptor subunit alpha-6a [Antennarius striatus]|uniref:gamma-aminobutyric acid receptor subunit alpha-6a n=1 Tax=Antennarius striatus TaxID=241820 RepID=UPI0035B10965
MNIASRRIYCTPQRIQITVCKTCWFEMSFFTLALFLPVQTHKIHLTSSSFFSKQTAPTFQLDSSPQEGLKRRNHSVCRSEPGEAPPLPIFLQQGSAFPQIPQLAGTSPIDKYARILFPLVFALFNLVYWYIYLVKDTMESARDTELEI